MFETSYGFSVEPHMVGGFLANLVGAALIIGGSMLIFGQDSPVIFFIFPIAILLINVISFIKNIFD